MRPSQRLSNAAFFLKCLQPKTFFAWPLSLDPPSAGFGAKDNDRPQGSALGRELADRDT
jgi:hypothetical protein